VEHRRHPPQTGSAQRRLTPASRLYQAGVADRTLTDDHTARIADEADRQSERRFASLGLGEEAGGQPSADRVQFELRYRPLQAEEEAPVGAAWMRQAHRPQMSKSGYQSEQLRARRVTSIDRISPTSLSRTRPTSSLVLGPAEKQTNRDGHKNAGIEP
jgi:hypothetical protein